MAGVYTETTMNMQHFHDFYFLEAVKAAATMEIAANPDLEFSKTVEKFLDNLDNVYEKVVPNMALRVFMYLYAACLGEARHARDSVAKSRFIKETASRGRSDLFGDIVFYRPTKKNLQTLVDIFGQEWRSGYGGEAWQNIAEALLEYETTPPGAWIDHVVDLEHNNGTAFSKPDGKKTIMFDVCYPCRFSAFLDYKFQKNILTKAPGFTMDSLAVSPRVYATVERYSIAFKKNMPKHIVPDLENLGDYTVEWGDKEFATAEKWAMWVDAGLNNKPNIKQLLYENGLGNIYVSGMAEDKVIAAVEKAKTRAISKMGSKATSYWKQKIAKAANEWFLRHKKYCKLPKAQTTYEILPCKITKAQTPKYTLTFPVSLEYGISNGDGETQIDITLYSGRMEETGYVARYYGDLVLWAGNSHYWISSQELEALLD